MCVQQHATDSIHCICACRQRRRDELTSIQQGISEAFAASLVGREIDVLVDGVNDDGWLIGRTQWDAPDVDPLVFLSEATEPGIAPLEVGWWHWDEDCGQGSVWGGAGQWVREPFSMA